MRWMIEEGLATQVEQRLRLTRKGYMLCDEISTRLARDVSLLLSPTGRAASSFRWHHVKRRTFPFSTHYTISP